MSWRARNLACFFADFGRSSWLVPCCALLACSFDLRTIPTSEAPLDAGRDAGRPAPPHPDHDAGATDGGLDAAVPSGILHPNCQQRLPDDWPEPQGIMVDVHGRPTFAAYLDIPCDQAGELATCVDAGTCNSPAVCVQQAAMSGVCAPDLDWNAQPISFAQGRCFTLLRLEHMAAVCCHKLAGFDCPGWPLESKAKPGQLCAHNVDCEPGLACRTATGRAFGVCSCPEANQEPTPCP